MIAEESREQRSGRLTRTTMAFTVVGIAIAGTVVLAGHLRHPRRRPDSEVLGWISNIRLARYLPR